MPDVDGVPAVSRTITDRLIGFNDTKTVYYYEHIGEGLDGEWFVYYSVRCVTPDFALTTLRVTADRPAGMAIELPLEPLA